MIPLLLLPGLLCDDRLWRDQAAALAEMAAITIADLTDSRPDLPSICVSSLVGVGAEDQLTPPDHAAEIAAGVAGAELHTFADCGHLAPMERPAEVSRLMRDWLSAGP